MGFGDKSGWISTDDFLDDVYATKFKLVPPPSSSWTQPSNEDPPAEETMEEKADFGPTVQIHHLQLKRLHHLEPGVAVYCTKTRSLTGSSARACGARHREL